MNILQVSAPKTGSYWLNTILKEILLQKEFPVTSFIQDQPQFPELKKKQLSFKDQARVDMIDIQDDGNFFRVSSLFKEPIKDINAYTNSATLAWTHSTWCSKSFGVFNLFEKKVCIVRDPRDRALSSAKFAFTPYMQKHYPTSYSSPGEFLRQEYERLLDQWKWFYGNYLIHREELDLHFVFYENLLEDFEPEFDRLLKYLELDLDPLQKEEIKNAVTFSSMKEESPRHLQKGRSRKWIQNLSEDQKVTAIEKTGELMKVLGYPISSAEEHKQLSVPQNVSRENLQKMMSDIDWQSLY